MRTLERLWLDRSAAASLQDQIARQIKVLIQRGMIAPGSALPSTRQLAVELKVSRNTAVYAYDRLICEGYLESRERAGVHVSSSITFSGHSRWPDPRMQVAEAPLVPSPVVPPGLGTPLPFRPSQPDVSLFPLRVWNRLRGRALKHYGGSLLHYQARCISGLPALCENVAAYLRDSRGVHCDARQVVITSGSQQALFILASLLVQAGDSVYIEDPGYTEARLAWCDRGARIAPGPVDAQGLRVPGSRLGRRLALIYTTPSRQFPTGVSLSLARRLALIDFASRTKTWVIEDDYDSELRYAAPPLPSLQSLDPSGRVIYVGTFSKLLFPSLRLGYAVLPPPLLDGFIELKHLIDDHLPLIDQATLASFLESGAFYSHIRRCRKAYAERQAVFLGLSGKAGIPLRFDHVDGGMNLTGFLPEGSDDAACSAALARAGLDVPPLSRFAVRPVPPGLVFGFTAFGPDLIRSSLERMHPVLNAALAASRPTGAAVRAR